MKWVQVRSKGAIDRFVAKLPQDGFTVSTEHGFLPSGDFGRTETYSVAGQPVIKTLVAKNHAYSRVYLISYK